MKPSMDSPKKPQHSALGQLLACAVLALSFASASGFATAADPKNLDELLAETESARSAEAAANAEREARFQRELDNQAALLAEAKARLANEQKRGAGLTTSFDVNEKAITDFYLTDDSSGLYRNAFYTEPRTYGVSVTKRW